ncbi:MAG TPA: polysaccharide biosynthesis tyrosine autokinase [Acidimicrobiales bacterium]
MVRAAVGARTSSEAAEPGLVDYLRILWRHKFLIVLTVVVATGTVVGLDRARTPVYQGTAQLLLTPQASTGSSSPADLSPTGIATDIQLVSSSPVRAAVTRLLHAPAPAVAVSEVGTTDVAQIAVRSTNPTFAAAAANAYAHAYITVATKNFVDAQLVTERQVQSQITAVQGQIAATQGQIAATPASATTTISQLQAQLSGLDVQLSGLQQQLSAVQLTTAQGSSAGQLVVPAAASSVPVSPKKTQDAVIAAGVGLLLGLGFALLRDHLDDRIRNADDLEAALGGLPTIGLIPALGEWRDRKSAYMVTKERPRSPSAEAYRALRTSIKFMAIERPVKVLQVTSPGASEGKTTTAANLAFAMGESGQRVVLIDCDLRRPRVHEFFALPNDRGLTSFLLDETPIDEALHRVPSNSGLLVLPAGPIPPNPSELLSGERADWLFRYLAESADIVILDSSPVLPVTDAVVLAARVDGVLLVASAGVSTARGLNRSAELLSRVDARLVGTVLNRAPSAAAYRYGYGYGYGYESAATPPAATNGSGPVVLPESTNGNGSVVKSGTAGDPPPSNGNGQVTLGEGWPAHARRQP